MFMECPHCGEYKTHYLSGWVALPSGRNVRRLLCANSFCGKFFPSEQDVRPPAVEKKQDTQGQHPINPSGEIVM